MKEKEISQVPAQKRFATQKYVLVFFCTLLLFVSGIGLGLYFGSLKTNQVQQLQENFRADSLDIEIQYSLLSQDPCRFVNTSVLTQKLEDIGQKLDFMGTTLGDNDTQVVQLKSYYSLLELSHWLFQRDVAKQCGTKKNVVLYFYSNVKSECPQCEDQGFILSYLKKVYGENLAVYSFDYHLDVDSLNMVRKIYGVHGVPSLVINNQLVSGFTDTNLLKTYLENTTNATDSVNISAANLLSP